VVDAFSVERARPPNDPVYLIILGEEQFSQIRAILAGYTRD
jgi:hypothetical protein